MIGRDIHPDTRRLADAIIKLAFGDLILKEDMSVVIGRDISQHRHIFYGAARLAQREGNVVLACVIGKGYRRLAPVEMQMIGQTARARTRGLCRRGNRSISAGIEGANGIPHDTFRKILAEQSTLGLLEHVARDRSLPTVPPEDTRPLTVAASARAFLRHIGVKAADGP